jgi:hypothetical protein
MYKVAMKPLFTAAFLAAVVSAQDAKPAYPPTGDEKIPLKVLYTGAADHPRTKDFTAFLEATFAKVGTVELMKLDATAAKDYDVVVVDAPSGYSDEALKDPSKIKLPKAPDLKDWTKPTVLMGAAGGAFLNHQNLKLDWL